MIAAPHRDRAIVAAFNFHFNRHECRRTMMLRPIELYPAGNPWPRKSNQGWLNNILSIEEVVSIYLVEADVDSSADLGQHHHANILIL